MKYGIVKPHIIEKIKSIDSIEVLDNLFQLTYKCDTIEEFSKYLSELTDN